MPELPERKVGWRVLRRHGKQQECLNREMPSQGRSGPPSDHFFAARAFQNLHPGLDGIGRGVYSILSIQNMARFTYPRERMILCSSRGSRVLAVAGRKHPGRENERWETNLCGAFQETDA